MGDRVTARSSSRFYPFGTRQLMKNDFLSQQARAYLGDRAGLDRGAVLEPGGDT
jgi:hypothetical protein